MKPQPILAIHLSLAILTMGVNAQDELLDPTRPSPRLQSMVRQTSSPFQGLTVKAIVIGANESKGILLFGQSDGSHVLGRPGTPFVTTTGNQRQTLLIQKIGSDGILVEAPETGESALLPSFGPSANDRLRSASDIHYAEFREVPLLDALRMLSDQTGQNYSSSIDANRLPISAMLRNVPADLIVEEICKTHGLWFKLDERTGILRIMTVAEFEKDLSGYREELSEVFTLRYPNVNEVATAIADLYGDRVRLSLPANENDEDMRNDLESRFDRFDVLTQRTLQSNAQQQNLIGGNVNGFFNNGGASGFGGFGNNSSINGTSRRNQGNDTFQRYEQRNNQRLGTIGDEGEFRELSPDQVARVESALSQGNESPVEDLRKRQATIYVTASRRNNIVAVRTADANAMAEIRNLVTQLDVPTPLVLLEVQIVSIELGNEFRSAFDYQFSDGGSEGSFRRTNIPLPLDGGILAGTELNSTDMTFVIANENFRARMQLFQSKNRVKTIAQPILLTANNEVSRLFLGEERPLIRNISSQTILTDNNVATTPNTTTEFRNIGTTLLITPNINSDRTVTLRLVQENSFINPGAATIPVVTTSQAGSDVQEVAIDTVGTRSISGTFVAKDGMMVAAGGLIENIDRDRRGQVPVLGSIPGAGLLFRRQDTAKGRSELVVIIRPHVLSTPADGQRLSKIALDRLAPESMEKLHETGFLPDLFPPAAPHPEEIPSQTTLGQGKPNAATNQKTEEATRELKQTPRRPLRRLLSR